MIFSTCQARRIILNKFFLLRLYLCYLGHPENLLTLTDLAL